MIQCLQEELLLSYHEIGPLSMPSLDSISLASERL